MQLTKEQDIAVRTVQNGEDLKLNAFAGSGKTSTLVVMAQALAPKRGLYLAFNKGIADEARAKMPPNVQCRTFHSMAYGAMPSWMMQRFKERQMHINDFCKKFKLTTIRYEANVDSYQKKGSRSVAVTMEQTKKISSYKVKRLVDLSLNAFLGSTDEHPKSSHVRQAIDDDLPELRKQNSFVYESLVSEITPIIQYLWADYSSPMGEMGIGGNHNVYLKYWSVSNPTINFDFVLFDEAQDADGLMLDILSKQECQVIYVGDKHQQIYAWRGAVNALDKIKANELYLTKSFRFGQPLADECKPILDVLGEKKKFLGTDATTVVEYDDITSTSQYANYDACLCRTNAEVVMTILELSKSNIPCSTNIDSKSIIQTLFDMKELQDNTKDVDLSLSDVQLYETKNKKLNHRSWEEFVIFMNEFNSEPELAITFDIYMNYGLNDITKALDSAGKSGGITVTTAHKAKGLEWDSIILKSDFLKGFFETAKDEIKYTIMEESSIYDQKRYVKEGGSLSDVVPIVRRGEDLFAELRLLYVAVTRAKKKANLGKVEMIFNDFFDLYDILKS